MACISIRCIRNTVFRLTIAGLVAIESSMLYLTNLCKGNKATVVLQRSSYSRNNMPEASRMRWAGHVARMGEVKGAYNILVGKPEGRRPLGSPRRRWEDNIKMDLREIGFGDVDWIHLAQDRDRWRAVVNTAMSLWVP
jgi:hypothetical protein